MHRESPQEPATVAEQCAHRFALTSFGSDDGWLIAADWLEDEGYDLTAAAFRRRVWAPDLGGSGSSPVYGWCPGDGYGDGDGYGAGYGAGYNSASGSGHGYGDGSGSADGYGNGDGSGDGYDDGRRRNDDG